MSLPFVSCLMPTKNRRKFIPAALKMWAAQDYPKKELIIVEDGDDDISDLQSTLRVKVKIDTTRHSDPDIAHIEYHRFEGTLGAKLNYAAKVAHGEICINWDDDDFMAPNRISAQIAHMQLTGKPFVGMSSLIFHQEGDDFGWEYTGDAWYASGSTHCYTREYALAHPRPDQTVGEDNVSVEQAAKLGALSTVSGLTCLVARNHPGNCSARIGAETTDPMQLLTIRLRDEGLLDQYKKIPLDRFRATIDAAR